MGTFAGAIYYFEKSSKMLYVKNEPEYSFYYILIHLVWDLATLTLGMEALNGNYYPLRKIIRKCLDIKPELYKPIFTDLIQAPKDKNLLKKVLLQIENYLDEIIELIYAPVINYVKKKGYPIPESELRDFLTQKGAGTHYYFLAQKGILDSTTEPIKLTTRSKVHMNEMAYFIDDGD